MKTFTISKNDAGQRLAQENFKPRNCPAQHCNNDDIHKVHSHTCRRGDKGKISQNHKHCTDNSKGTRMSILENTLPVFKRSSGHYCVAAEMKGCCAVPASESERRNLYANMADEAFDEEENK